MCGLMVNCGLKYIFHFLSRFRYQWYKNGTDLKFGQSAVLKYPVARPENSGVYSCSVANDHGSILCVPFTVEVTRVRGTTFCNH